MDVQDKFRGDAFPDLEKAKAAKPLTDLVAKLIKDDKELYQIADDEKLKRRKQLEVDFCSFSLSQSTALQAGNKNACVDKAQFTQIANQQEGYRDKIDKSIVLPVSTTTTPYGTGKNQTKLPKPRTAGAIQGGAKANRNQPLSRTKFHNGGQGLVTKLVHYVTPIKPSNQADKAADNHKAFMQAHAGKRGTSIGDRALVISGNGTPHYGDSYLDKSQQENLSANQATSTPAMSYIPKDIKVTKPIDAAKLNRTKAAQIHPKSDTIANIAALGVVAAAVTAIMFAVQYVIGLVSFVLQIQTLTSTVTNMAASFLGIFNNIASLFGLGKHIAKPLEETIDGLLNNAFGKENVAYVKLQFAKINTAFTAGVNIIQKIGSSSTNLSNAIEESGNNTSRIGNALKGAGIIGEGIKWMNEQISAKQQAPGKIGDLTNALNTVSTLSSDLSSITQDVVTAKTETERLEKEYQDKEKEKLEGQTKATETHTDPVIPEVPAIQQGSI
jgi:hypothetical protein